MSRSDPDLIGSILDGHAAQLGALGARGRLRRLLAREGRDFSSNDYLGLAGSRRLATAVEAALGRGVPVGSGGSRLLRGNHPEHETLEAEAAVFFGSESALYFSGGYAANGGLLAALPERGDLVVHDALIHASVHDGIRLGRADAVAAQHNDADAFEAAITAWRKRGGRGRAWLAVESLYSMDGDRAPLEALTELAERYEAFLLIDEAHAVGVFGPEGRGFAAHLDGRDNVVVLRTCGKALGCEGGLVCAPAVIKHTLVNRARPFVFATAPSPLMAAAVREALRILVDEPDRRERLRAHMAGAEVKLARHRVRRTGSQILPLILGENDRTMEVAAGLQAQGFDVRGIRPPTVPRGTSRLRLSITLNTDADDIEALDRALERALAG